MLVSAGQSGGSTGAVFFHLFASNRTPIHILVFIANAPHPFEEQPHERGGARGLCDAPHTLRITFMCRGSSVPACCLGHELNLDTCGERGGLDECARMGLREARALKRGLDF